MKKIEENQLSLKQILDFRIEKLNKIKSSGINPYPNKFYKKDKISDILKSPKENLKIETAGRIISIRKMGKSCFMNLQGENSKIQIYIKSDLLDDDLYDNLIKNIDIGDVLGIHGNIFYTRTKELSIKVSNVFLLSKNLYPLPNIKEKEGKSFFAFDDKELRYRNRYMDLIVNPDVKDVFVKRFKIINEIRSYLNNLDYIEVETPILQPIYGGANAKPFKTYHNSLDKELYLRIADELYLKRLIIGGFEKVYEISKNFRNEGMDRSHNPEFTMLEYYQAYADVNDMMKITEKMIKSVYSNVFNNKELIFNGHKINMENKYNVLDFSDSLKKYANIDLENFSKEDLSKFIKKQGLKISKNENYGNLLDKVFSHFVEPNLINPTFIINYPIELSPLAKKISSESKIVERFELFIGGMELANAFTELNDPIDQLKRLEKQSKLKELGDEEAQVVDHDFIKAMKVGMPPTGGVGIGIDRLTMIFTSNKSIKDVILFPAMR